MGAVPVLALVLRFDASIRPRPHPQRATGQVHVWRGPGAGSPHDAEEIHAIRHGAWTYDQLVEWAECEDAALQVMYDQRRYVVPKMPDREGIDRLCVALVETALREGGESSPAGAAPKAR